MLLELGFIAVHGPGGVAWSRMGLHVSATNGLCGVRCTTSMVTSTSYAIALRWCHGCHILASHKTMQQVFVAGFLYCAREQLLRDKLLLHTS